MSKSKKTDKSKSSSEPLSNVTIDIFSIALKQLGIHLTYEQIDDVIDTAEAIQTSKSFRKTLSDVVQLHRSSYLSSQFRKLSAEELNVMKTINYEERL